MNINKIWKNPYLPRESLQSSELSKLSSNRTCLITFLLAVMLPGLLVVFLMEEIGDEAINLKMLVGPVDAIVVEGGAATVIEAVVLVMGGGGVGVEPVDMGGRGGGGGMAELGRGRDGLDVLSGVSAEKEFFSI